MNLKTVEIAGKTYAELQDNKPVFIADDGKEIAFDAPGTRDTITRLNGEAKGHRERAERAEAALKPYEGIKDPVAAVKALETVANLDGKKLIDAGEAERFRAETAKGFEAKLAEANKINADLAAQYSAEKISTAFVSSKFVKDNLTIPPDIALAVFGKNFTVDGGKIIAKGMDGSPIYSTARPGEHANTDEALAVLINSYPNRDSIMRGANQSGGGSQPGRGGAAGAKSMTQAQFDTTAPKDRAAFFAAGGALTD